MRRFLAVSLLVLSTLPVADPAGAAGRRVVHPGRRTVVTVHRGFPLHRRLPHVYVRTPVVAVRTTPRLFLPPVVFGTVVVAAPARDAGIWFGEEKLDRDDGWTELTLNVDRRGNRLLLEIDQAPARISFAEVVFENGEAQVVDFDDRVHAPGTYALLDFKDGRKVDHVRVVAKTEAAASALSLYLLG